MKKRSLYLFLPILVLILIFFFLKKDTSEKSSRVKNSSILEDVSFKKENISGNKKKEIDTVPKNQNSILKNKIKNHFPHMQFVGEGAEEKYQRSIDELRKNKDEVTELLIQDYSQITEENYLLRQQIIETMRALHSEKSIPIFTELLMEKFPEEKSQDIHHGSTQLEEGIIRLTAIEGLGYFAKEGSNKEVLITLLEIVKNTNSPLPLKRQAVREYLHSSKDKETLAKNKTLLKEFLPKESHFIVTEKVDQPEEQLPDFESPRVHHHDHSGHSENEISEFPKIKKPHSEN